MTRKSRRSFLQSTGTSLLAGGVLAAHGLPASATGMAITQDAASQAVMTPERALDLLKAGNQRFVESRMFDHDLAGERKATAAGQFPLAAIVGCIDSRASNELIFDQSIGDIFSTRVAGNYIDDGVLGGLEFACVLSGARLVLVVGHDDCGAVKGACDDVILGNLTQTLANIKPAVAATEGFEADRSSSNGQFVQAVAVENVRLSLERIRTRSPLLREMEMHGEIGLQGGMYDLESGRVTFL
jgi:carbonic anhydrase